MEMLEHVPDPGSIVRACATLVKPGGWVFFSTINRNPKAFLFAIVGAVKKGAAQLGEHLEQNFRVSGQHLRSGRHDKLVVVCCQ